MIMPVHSVGGRHTEVFRKAKYPVAHILPRIGIKRDLKAKMNLDGDMVGCSTLKLKMFKEKGCKCASCGIEGIYFAKEYEIHQYKDKIDKQYFLQLYAVNENGEVVITVDHIIPQSKGGRSQNYNLQPMCYVCNQKKTNNMPSFRVFMRVWIKKKIKEKNKIVYRIKCFLNQCKKFFQIIQN